jgi:NAD+ synthase (glutamine-hydrolysing)
MNRLRVALAQLDTVVGDIEGNVARILEALAAAEAAGAHLCAFPELAITGYPPEDLLLKPGFVADGEAGLAKVAAATGDCVALVGHVEPLGQVGRPERDARPEPAFPVRLANSVAVCHRGRVVGTYRKRRLPNYGVFDEDRYFTAGQDPVPLFEVAGVPVAATVCEDLWFDDGPVAQAGRSGAALVVNLNASPYSVGRRAERLALLRRRVAEAGCPVAYVNQVGGQDELVFDGASLVVDRSGALTAAGPQFEPALVVADVEVDAAVAGPAPAPRPAPALPQPLDPVAECYAALVLGTRDYLQKNGFGGAVVGLSGGIDSSLVAAVAVDALGPGAVHGLSMPSRYSSTGSRDDAAALARRLGIDLRTVPIEEAHAVLAGALGRTLGHELTGLPDENLQSRIRGVLLMGVSNAEGWIVLTTGNKSELATGYSTLYGDSAGGFAVIKDVPKTLVYELCRHRNAVARARGEVPPIPEEVLDKPPSAELRPDQRDDQSLPPYDELDPVLAAYVERDRTAADLVAEGFDPALVDRVVRLVDGAEYKRRQMPPGVRLSTKAFGKDRRMPITNHYRPPAAAEGGRE